MKLLEGLGGLRNGSFFRAPPRIDLSKRPGKSRIVSVHQCTIWKQIVSYGTASYFLYSPNLVWFLIACIQWNLAPYTFEKLAPTNFGLIFLDRLRINLVVVLTYYSFWYVALDVWKWGRRPFAEKRDHSYSKVTHNVFYSTLGVIQWTVTESAFLFVYTTGRLPFYDAETDFKWLIPHLLLGSLAVPIIRDIHFYFAHRFLHTRFLYKYLHSLHHRNTDVEPFSGLAMHPAEHLYYFTCYGPLLWTKCHPFLLLWMGIHVTLSPAAAHSGYEDHWQADLYHYLHHRYFECNYGSPALPIDKWCGTFRDILGDQTAAPIDSKATLWGQPTWQDSAFYVLGIFGPLWYLLAHGTTTTTASSVTLTAGLLATAPLWAAAVLHLVSYSYQSSSSSLWRHFMSPFHQDTTVSFVLHTLMGGLVCCVLPLMSLLIVLLKDPPIGE